MRYGTVRDIAAIAAAWQAVLERHDIPFTDPRQARVLVRECVSGGYVLVDEGAALVARVHGRIWRRHKQATVVAWFNDGRPGIGMAMMREFIDWTRARRGIREVALHCDLGYDSRLLRILDRRYGFSTPRVLTLD